jgi:hypothetical protein
MDLFEDPKKWPANLRAILFSYIAKDQTYANILQLEKDLLKIGYSFEFGLDSIPYNLHKMGT